MYYKIYCDGSANLQKQKGGIGILIILCNDDNLEISATEYSEGFDNVTNNQMEYQNDRKYALNTSESFGNRAGLP